MREQLARAVAAMTAVLAFGLALLFASMQNPPGEPPPARSAAPAAVAPDAETVAAGRRIYEEQGCSSCHSIAGEGNPRNPLDGVSARHEPVDMRNWIVGAGAAGDQLSPRVRNTKRAYAELGDHELNALVAYLRRL
jgi:mono/diheme cytochrome c family protein